MVLEAAKSLKDRGLACLLSIGDEIVLADYNKKSVGKVKVGKVILILGIREPEGRE